MSTNIEKDLVDKLKSSNINEVYDALLKIRKNYVRNQQKMKKLQKYSVIKLIIPFIEHPKFCNISLSIIADGCLELSFVNDVIKHDGIKSLMRIMKSFVNNDIQNRACRALGNMAKFEVGFKAIHLVKPISNIINFLSETNDANCQQTAVRTLMILGKSSKTRELIAQQNGIIYIAKLLHSSNVQLLICSTKAIANLTQNCSISCARKLLELQFLKVLVKLHSHSNKSVQSHALISLKNLSSHEEIRSGLVKVGAIKLFTEILSACESYEMCRLAALALCSCLDHIHMWSQNGTERSIGLKSLLDVLKSKQFQDIHIHVIASLIPLSYEFKVADILLNLNVLQILIEILKFFIEKHKCKSVERVSCRAYFSEKDLFTSDCKKDKIFEAIQFDSFCEKSENEVSKDEKSDVNYINIPKNSIYHDKSQDVSPKTLSKYEHSFNNFSSMTSDYSGSCSPSQKYSASPEINYEIDFGSPSTGHTSGVWSPVSFSDENVPQLNCWSPVVSTNSDSPIPESDFIDYDKIEDDLYLFTSSTKNITSTIPEINSPDEGFDASLHCNLSLPYKLYSTDEKQFSALKHKSSSDDILTNYSEINVLRKKLKIENSDHSSGLPTQTSVNTVDSKYDHISDKGDQLTKSNSDEISPNCFNDEILDVKAENIDSTRRQSQTLSYNSDISNTKHISCDNKQSNFKLLNENIEVQTIDHYVILFILQLSFHLEKKINSQLADKSCFSVLIDYLCFLHNPSPKAETVLLNLIRNRYCVEKLIINGFVSELEEKMTSPCFHRSCVKLMYTNLINVGRKEVESDYGIGTLSHILITSDKMGQFHTLCAMSKLVTEKVSLYRLLFEANGLSLLLSFLSASDVEMQRKLVTSLCELYQSLTKEHKNEKCCFMGTCSMKTSSKCCYKESFLNVTFSVCGGVKILASREKICASSDYFRALLKGHFLETKSDLVFLPDISAENLSTIFHFLHGCGSGNCCPYIKRIPFSVLLELLSDCEKFLLINIKTFVEDRLCHRLFPSTIPKIYKQSKIHNSSALTKRTLEFALSMDTSQKELMWNCFKELIILESNLNFLGDIESLLKSIF